VDWYNEFSTLPQELKARIASASIATCNAVKMRHIAADKNLPRYHPVA